MAIFTIPYIFSLLRKLNFRFLYFKTLELQNFKWQNSILLCFFILYSQCTEKNETNTKVQDFVILRIGRLRIPNHVKQRVIHLHINIYIFTYLHSLHIIISIFLMVIAIFLQWTIMCNSDPYKTLSPLVETDWRGKKYFENQNDRSCWSLSLDIKDASLLF